MRYTEFKVHLHEGKLSPAVLYKYGPDSPRMVAFVDKLNNGSPFELNTGGTVVLARPDEHDGHNQNVIDKLDQIDRATEALSQVGLESRMDHQPSELSGGQQQRVAVARALASKPQFVLADEPTANLDSQSTANLLDIMERLNKEEGMTFVFATHDDRVIKKARRIISIEDGKVLSDD